MRHANPMKFRGLTLTAIAREKPEGEWSATIFISDDVSRQSEEQDVLSFKSADEAVQNALENAMLIVSGKAASSNPKFRPRLTEDEYLLELNRRLSTYKFFKPDMTFVTRPHGTTGSEVNGWDVLPPGGPSNEHILAATSMLSDFEVFASQRPI